MFGKMSGQLARRRLATRSVNHAPPTRHAGRMLTRTILCLFSLTSLILFYLLLAAAQ
jgi:hypothetical protein